jgi:UDP-N-acetylmuramoylalanine--D-glutamate ligase
MIKLTPFSHKTVGVFGLGKAGSASVTALLDGGATVYAWDDKPVAFENAARIIPYQDWPWETLSALVIAPGVPLTHPTPHAVVLLAQEHNVRVLGDIELLYRAQPDATYLGITGTNGKSTTTTLIGHIFHASGKRAEVGGNLGTAALLLAPLSQGETYILETSSYQLDLLQTARFNIAILLNVTPDHLDRHGDMKGYIAAKKHIFDRQQASDVAIIAIDDEHTKALYDAGVGEGKMIPVSTQYELAEGVFVKDGMLYDHLPFVPHALYPMPLQPIASLTGRHNWQNAAVAYAAARAAGIEPEVIYAALKSFAGLRHRLQLVDTIKGVRFINDSKATNADAVSHALAPYRNIYWIAGGKAKSGGIESLAHLFPHIKRAYLIGEAEDMFAQTLEGTLTYQRCGTLQAALNQAAADAFSEGLRDAVVLLSPACASFDQFTSFEHRGDVFCELVEGIADAS